MSKKEIETNDDVLVEDELDALKKIADNMGLKYHPSISLVKLKDKVELAKEPVASGKVVSLNKMEARKEHIKGAKKLVRCRVVNMNPSRRDSKGEYITVSNKFTGTIKRFVPFDVEWHVENFVYKVMRDRKYRKTLEEPDGKGGKISRNIFIPEFNIEILPQLTTKELEALAADQAKRGAIDNH